MRAHEDRILAIHLTLGHYLQAEDGHWVRIAGLVLDGDEVVVTCCDGRARARIPATAMVTARVAGAVGDPSEERELDVRMVGWYGGDLEEAAQAVDEHDHPAEPRPTKRVAYGHVVPEFERDEDLVGIYGGDLEAVADAFGAAADTDARALRQKAFERGMGVRHEDGRHQDGAPPEPEPDDETSERIAGWYAGDIDSVVASQPHPESPRPATPRTATPRPATH